MNINTLSAQLVGTKKGNLTCTKVIETQLIELTCDCGVVFETHKRHIKETSKMQDCGCRMTGIKPGDKFGQWTVVGPSDPVTFAGRVRALVECDCGKQDVLAFTSLRDGKTPTCFCKRGEQFIGERYGRLTVTGTTARRRGGNIVLLCKCDCGNTKETIRVDLMRGNTTSCGCRQREIASARGKAGMPKTDTHGYPYAHKLVSKDFGLASLHDCAQCNKVKADEWAYTHDCPNEIVSTQTHYGLVYSLDTERYVALCTPCHNAFDTAHRKGVALPITRPAYERVGPLVKADGRKTPRRGTPRELKRQITVAKKAKDALAVTYMEDLHMYDEKIAALEAELEAISK